MTSGYKIIQGDQMRNYRNSNIDVTDDFLLKDFVDMKMN